MDKPRLADFPLRRAVFVQPLEPMGGYSGGYHPDNFNVLWYIMPYRVRSSFNKNAPTQDGEFLQRNMVNHVVAFGSNLGERKKNIELGCSLIVERIGPKIALSSIYETEPVLHPDIPTLGQRTYLNGVMVIQSELQPWDVLTELLKIEREVGRDRDVEERPWAPRVIDLDLIASDSTIVKSDFLSLPHPEMHRRLFVLEPMLEVIPDWVHPVLELSVAELHAQLLAGDRKRKKSTAIAGL